MTRETVRFLRKGQVVELDHISPTRTVLEYLRLDARQRGTKEGCNEGDCGACTVALGSLKSGRLVYEPVNACILLLAQLDGKELVTVDDLAEGDVLHPVQQAMVDHHGSQCGFCTPGFVMSIFTLYQQGGAPTRRQIAEHIAGNLCRCTGYRPIVDAAEKSCTGSRLDRWAEAAPDTERKLGLLADNKDVFIGASSSFIASPARVETLLELRARHPDAIIVSGATDVGLWITKQMRALPKIILTGRVSELHGVESTAKEVRIGAAATYAEAAPELSRLAADVGAVIRRIGSTQVRASGTIGGNIANGSPIGDTPPMLIALGATLHLRSRSGARSLALEDYFIAYGKQDRAADELVWRIDVPLLAGDEVFRAYKLSKRFDQDISAVMAAFKFKCDGRRISSARVAFGGMAATPKRATNAEAALAGLSLDHPMGWSAAVAALAKDFAPISDMRATAEYRLVAAQGLLRRALIEVAGASAHDTRVVDLQWGAA